MESVTALEQNHPSTDIKSAGAFESGRRDARPALSVPTVWQRSQDTPETHGAERDTLGAVRGTLFRDGGLAGRWANGRSAQGNKGPTRPREVIVVTTTQGIVQHLMSLSESARQEVLDFVQFLESREAGEVARRDNARWSRLSLTSAMRGMEGEDSPYALSDLKEVFK